MVEEELGALSELLGDQPYLFGHRWDAHADPATFCWHQPCFHPS